MNGENLVDEKSSQRFLLQGVGLIGRQLTFVFEMERQLKVLVSPSIVGILADLFDLVSVVLHYLRVLSSRNGKYFAVLTGKQNGKYLHLRESCRRQNEYMGTFLLNC